MNKIKEAALRAANDIADDFVVGFVDHRMVENFAAQIENRIRPIIDESIEVLASHSQSLDYGDDYETGYFYGFADAIDLLTEHFGINR